MSIRDMAESDLAETLEGEEASPFTLIDPSGDKFELKGTLGDIGYLLDNETGLPVQGRTITAAYRIKTLLEKTVVAPGKDWKVKATGLDGKEYTLFVLNYEPDRTLGVGRIKLGCNDE